MNKEYKKDAYCGLYCASCPGYMATEAGTASEKGMAECKGCKSDHVMGEWCSNCAIKDCARGKGLDFCVECNEYPCVKMDQFKEDKDYPYHSEVYDYLDTIKTMGKAAWLEKMSDRWKCSECGTAFNWWTLNCSNCGKPVKGYENPN